MASDEHIQISLERLLAGLRGPLEAALRADGEHAADEARRRAEAEVAEVRAAAARENDDLRASADAQIAELKRMLDDIRTTAEQQIDTARRTLETEVAAVRARARAEVEDGQRAMNERLGALTRDLNAVRVQLDAARTDAEAAWRDLENAHKEVHTARLNVARSTDRGRLPEDLRALDEAASLSDVLDRLTQAAARHAERAALLIVGNGRLRRWKLIGMPGGATDGSTDLLPDKAGIAADALRDRRAARRAAGERGPVPMFAPDAGSREQVALPVTVAGAVVAVLYADAPGGGAARQGWQDDLDLLARYSSRVLETITVQQASGIRPVPRTRNPEPGTMRSSGSPRTGEHLPGGSL